MSSRHPTITVRRATVADGAALASIYRPIVRDTAISFEIEPPDADEMGRRIASGARFVPWAVAEDGGRIVGFAYAAPFRSRPAYRWTCETTVYVDAAHRRRSVARTLYRRLLAELAARGFRTAIAVVTLPNPASVALHEALGFRAAGVLPRVGHKAGRWRDTGWWSLDLAPDAAPTADPAPPRVEEPAP